MRRGLSIFLFLNTRGTRLTQERLGPVLFILETWILGDKETDKFGFENNKRPLKLFNRYKIGSVKYICGYFYLRD